MPLPDDLPIVDHHCHLSPHGEGVAAARRFAAAGGTHLLLATQNYSGKVPRSLEDYRAQFETTCGLADAVREQARVEVRCVLAPYPVDLVRAAPVMGLAPALALQCEALDLAGRWVRDGRAVALGEVGTPHFPVDDEVRTASDAALDHALAVAKDVGCPVVVHSADLDRDGYRQLAARGARAGLPPHRIVKHYARSVVSSADRSSVVPSYLARRDLVSTLVGHEGPWFLETDFLDDPSRPGAVLDLATVPRRALALAARGPEMADLLRIPFVESFETVYGWRPETRRRGAG